MGDKILSLKNITAGYGEQIIIKDICIDVRRSEIVSVIGSSGVGKSTLFNVIAGLLRPVDGKVILNGQDVTGISGNVSYMLQKDLLLPFKTVGENIALPLMIRGMRKKEALNKVSELLPTFGLENCLNVYPSSLSGGMRQRAALLRTYMMDGQVSLLDEPFSALDSLSKNKMHDWFLDLLKKIDLSAVLITHDIDEALKLSDRICLLKGRPAGIDSVFDVSVPREKRTTTCPDLLVIKEEILNRLGD